MVFLGERGYCVIAHDRRGHGRSSQTWNGNDMDTYADDLAELIDALDLNDIILVGHSTGGGEVARYIGRHGTARVAKAVLLGAVPPLMLKTEANPDGTPIEVFDRIRKGTFENRSQFFKDLSMPFYGYNRPGAKVSEGLRDSFWLQGMQAGIKAALDCIRQFSETDFTEDLKKIRCADADRAWRRRSDRADRRIRPALGEDRQEFDSQDLSRRAARSRPDPAGRVQRRPAGVHRELSRLRVAAKLRVVIAGARWAHHRNRVQREGPK